METKIQIREMQLEDVEDIYTIEKECFSRPWTKEALQEIVVDNKALYLVAFDEITSQVVGYVGAYLILDEADINQVAVAPSFRRMKIASLLLQDFMQKLSKKGIASVTLEVRKSNKAAILLYEKMGFVTEGIRKNFYEAPTEDACIMWKR